MVKSQSTLKYLAKGKRSFVFLTRYKNKKAIIKKARPNKEARINHEANILKLLNRHKIGPRLFYAKDNEICMEFIEGKTIKDFLETLENENSRGAENRRFSSTEKNKLKIKKIAIECLNQCYALDKLKLNKEEMCNPYKHVIITKTNNVVMIDFERSRFTEKPSNITQFFQYLSSKKLVTFNEELKRQLKDYKNNPNKKNYEKLKNY